MSQLFLSRREYNAVVEAGLGCHLIGKRGIWSLAGVIYRLDSDVIGTLMGFLHAKQEGIL